ACRAVADLLAAVRVGEHGRLHVELDGAEAVARAVAVDHPDELVTKNEARLVDRTFALRERRAGDQQPCGGGDEEDAFHGTLWKRIRTAHYSLERQRDADPKSLRQ